MRLKTAFDGSARTGPAGWVGLTAVALATVVLASGCGSSDKKTASPAKTTSSAAASKSSSLPATTAPSSSSGASSAPATSAPATGLARHLLQLKDVGSGASIKPIAGTALTQAAQQIAGAASTTRSTSNKPACTTAMNSGIATKPIDPKDLAGEVATGGNSALTEIIGPKAAFARGIAYGTKQAQACTGATISQTVNGVKASTKPTFRKAPGGFFVVDSTVTVPGKPAVHTVNTVGVAGNYGIQLVGQSTGAIPAATFDRYITTAIIRAKG